MSTDTHVFESLPAYAVGSLEESEAQSVAEHITACVICRRELDSFQSVADQLALTAPDVSPSADLKQRLMDRVRNLDRKSSLALDPAAWPAAATPRAKWSGNRLLPIGGIVGLLLITLLALSNLFLWQRIQHLEVLSGPNGMRAIALEGSDAAPRSSAFMVIGADGQNGALVVDQLPPLEEGKEYQLWLVRDGETTSGGVFSVDESGYRGIRVEAPASLLTYSEVHVTIEPAGGSQSPTGEPVLSGSLFNP